MHHFSEVDQRIAHPTQCGIDAHIGLFGNVFKAHVPVMTHFEHFLLLLRQVFHQPLHIIMNLSNNQFVFNGFLIYLEGFKQVVFLAVFDKGMRFDLRKKSIIRLCAMRITQGKNLPSSL
jgi:hypothetical protein